MTKIKYSPSSIALGLNIEHFFKTRDKASASQVITWLCPKNEYGVEIPDIKSVLERMIHPIATQALYDAYLQEREAHVIKELENPSYLYIKESEPGKTYQVLPTEEELRADFRAYSFSYDLAHMSRIDIFSLIRAHEEQLHKLIPSDRYLRIRDSLGEIKVLLADEFFRRLIAKEGSKRGVAESAFKLFREKFPEEKIPEIGTIQSWMVTNSSLQWLQNIPRYKDWEKITLKARDEGDLLP